MKTIWLTFVAIVLVITFFVCGTASVMLLATRHAVPISCSSDLALWYGLFGSGVGSLGSFGAFWLLLCYIRKF